MPTILLAALAAATLPIQKDTVTVREVKEFYEEIFAVERDPDGRTFFSLGRGQPVLSDGHTLDSLLRGNEFFFSYLVRNWSGIDSDEFRAYASDVDRFPDNYYSALQRDSVFNSLFLPIVARFLDAQGGKLSGFEVQGAETRKVTSDRSQEIAARFFYPDGVDDEGWLTAHVCVGINGMLDLAGGRDALVEALAYLAINKEMLESIHGVQEAFLDSYNHANGLNLSSDDDTRVIRAQGVMWATMHESQQLRDALQAEQARIAEWLPVRIE